MSVIDFYFDIFENLDLACHDFGTISVTVYLPAKAGYFTQTETRHMELPCCIMNFIFKIQWDIVTLVIDIVMDQYIGMDE